MKTRMNVNNKKSTKKALAMSVLSCALSCAMLAGSTFAWFTDSASGKNLISTGNLDVELMHVNSAGELEKVTADTALFLNNDATEGANRAIKWEPGVVATETFVVANEGDLDLKFDLKLNAEDEAGVAIDEAGTKQYLGDSLRVAILPATVTETDVEGGKVTGVTAATVTRNAAHVLDDTGWEENGYWKDTLRDSRAQTDTLTEGEKKAYTVVVYWEPQANTVDNIFNMNNDKTSPYTFDMSIELNATQTTGDVDSIGDDYDTGAYDVMFSDGVASDEGNMDDPLGG